MLPYSPLLVPNVARVSAPSRSSRRNHGSSTQSSDYMSYRPSPTYQLLSLKLVEGVFLGVGRSLRISDSPEIQALNRNSVPPRVLCPASTPSSLPQGGRHLRSPSLGEYLRPK